MLRKIRLYGKLAKFIGKRVLEADVATAAEAVRFLAVNWPGLEKHMADQYYRVSVGKYDLGEDELHDPAGQSDIKIVPVVVGAGDVGKVLAGVAIVVASILLGPVGAVIGGLGAGIIGGTVATIGIGIGASLVLGGVAGMLTPVPKLSMGSTANTEKDPRKSYSFSGVQNTSRQGVPVPIVYGETLVGSVVVSAGIDTVQVSA